MDKFFSKNAILPIPKISSSLYSSFNIQNILAAYAVVKILKLDTNKFVECVSHFVGLPHRMEEIINNKETIASHMIKKFSKNQNLEDLYDK